jgi:serine/threonine-protein kinase RsbT
MSASQGEITIQSEGDLITVRLKLREAAAALGFGATDTSRILTACSEMAQNVLQYGGGGTMRWRAIDGDHSPGIEVQFTDSGPGIPDINLALKEGYTTTEGAGMGLPGAKMLMDDLRIESQVGKGTAVTLKKWRSI